MKKVPFTLSLVLCLCYVYTRVLAAPPVTNRTEFPSHKTSYPIPRTTILKEGQK